MTDYVKWGITALSHDASLAVICGPHLVFAAHSERYSRIKNDKHLNLPLVDDALKWGVPSRIYFYERPLLKRSRQLLAGQFDLLKQQMPKSYLKQFANVPITYVDHHESHAAAGYYTSGYESAAILVVDSIGEWETLSVWRAFGSSMRKIFVQHYPHSVGLWYSAMTQRIGMIPQEHEYILMGMAALGDPNRLYEEMKEAFIKKMPTRKDPRVLFNWNLHRGCSWWRPDLTEKDYPDIAAATQRIFEEIYDALLGYTRDATGESRLVLMGGCALNCVGNNLARKHFDSTWIMPNPGDAGSAIGAILAETREQVKWYGPFLGHVISGEYPIEAILAQLEKTQVAGVASGRAEFGPRALGNRSLLADPRGADVKDRVNQYKHREPFRPFAPAILAEHVAEYFDVPAGFSSPYMQYTARCKRPDLFPAIVHYDNTSRIQTVTHDDNPGFRRLLEQWYTRTGCPMLLNTSLNIKGEPLVNSLEDAKRWEQSYGIPVCVPN